jgi:hypothetical protein
LAEFFHRAAPALSPAEKAEADRRLTNLSRGLVQKAQGDSSPVFVQAFEAIKQSQQILKGEVLSSVMRGNDYDFVGDVLE